MRILMLDDHQMFLQGLKTLLGVLAPQLCIDTADTLAEALRHVREARHDLILLDWHLAETCGERAIDALREAGCMGRIVVLSGETDPELIRHTIECGAAGFIPKQYTSEMMIAALRRVLAGQIFLHLDTPIAASDGAAPAPLEADPRLADLTPRQLDVYRAAARGLSNKLIARELGIAPSTVKTHLAAVYAALGVSNRTEAAYQASRERLSVF